MANFAFALSRVAQNHTTEQAWPLEMLHMQGYPEAHQLQALQDAAEVAAI